MQSARPPQPTLSRPDRSTLRTTEHCALGGVISPLFANIALTALDEPFEAAWAATSKYRGQRNYLRSKGHATYRLIRYSDDFVIMVHGNQAQAEALKAETTAILARQGLRLSEAKTHITHVETGFDFLGFRIQRRQREARLPAPTPSCPNRILRRSNRK